MTRMRFPHRRQLKVEKGLPSSCEEERILEAKERERQFNATKVCSEKGVCLRVYSSSSVGNGTRLLHCARCFGAS